MSETLTMNETPADQPELNADEQESLSIAEANEAEQQQLLAGKFKDTESLEQAYLELQKKLGESNSNVRSDEGEQKYQETETSEEVDNQPEDQPQTLTEAQAQQLFQMVGGEKAYQSMIKWAAENLSQAEIDMYDAVVGRAEPNSVFFAVQALAGKYSEAVGQDSQLLTGRGSNESKAVFRSQAELVQAMSDPRYDSDPAYRQDVMRKLDNSDIQF